MRDRPMQTNAKTMSDVPAINRFLSYCRVRTVPSKTVMIHAGDLPDVLYYIVDGSVEVMIEDEDGNEMVLAYLNKGQFFGEMGLFYEQPTRSAWVRTRTECEIAEMTYPRFRQIASESPGLVFELATQLATRLDRTNRKLGDLAFVDVTEFAIVAAMRDEEAEHGKHAVAAGAAELPHALKILMQATARVMTTTAYRL